jgi:hypothetical protein
VTLSTLPQADHAPADTSDLGPDLNLQPTFDREERGSQNLSASLQPGPFTLIGTQPVTYSQGQAPLADQPCLQVISSTTELCSIVVQTPLFPDVIPSTLPPLEVEFTDQPDPPVVVLLPRQTANIATKVPVLVRLVHANPPRVLPRQFPWASEQPGPESSPGATPEQRRREPQLQQEKVASLASHLISYPNDEIDLNQSKRARDERPTCTSQIL